MIRTKPPSDLLPLRGEDPIEDGALPAVPCGLQDKHVLDDVEGKAIIREGTQELGLQEGGPFLLQHTLTSLITLQAAITMLWNTVQQVKHTERKQMWCLHKMEWKIIWLSAEWMAYCCRIQSCRLSIPDQTAATIPTLCFRGQHWGHGQEYESVTVRTVLKPQYASKESTTWCPTTQESKRVYICSYSANTQGWGEKPFIMRWII